MIDAIYRLRKEWSRVRLVAKLEYSIARRFDRCCHEGRMGSMTLAMELRMEEAKLFTLKLSMNSTYGGLSVGECHGEKYFFHDRRPRIAQ